MIATRRLDSNGDWCFGNGRNDYLTGSQCVEQSVVTRLRCVVNDWFLNLDFGIDYFGGSPYIVEEQIRQTILRTVGVAELVSLTTDYNGDSRTITVTASLKDNQGNLLEVTA